MSAFQQKAPLAGRPPAQRGESSPIRVSISPDLMDIMAPEPPEPRESSLFPVWRAECRRTVGERARLRRQLAAHALRQVFRRAGGRLDVANLPFGFPHGDETVSCTLSLSVSATGTLHLEVSPWDGDPDGPVFSAAEMRSSLERNLAAARRSGRTVSPGR